MGKWWENHGIIWEWKMSGMLGLSWDDHGIIMGNILRKLHCKKIQL